MGKKRYEMRELYADGIVYGWEVYDTAEKESVYSHLLEWKVREMLEQLNRKGSNG